MQQQLTRAITGVTPDKIKGRAVASSRFLSSDLQLEAYEAAMARYKFGDPSLTIDLGKVVGEGYLKGGRNVGQTTKATAYFNSSGQITTIFPELIR